MRSVFLGGAAAIALVLAGVAAPAHADNSCELNLLLPSSVQNDGSVLSVPYTDFPVGCALTVPLTYDGSDKTPSDLGLTADDVNGTIYATSIDSDRIEFDISQAGPDDYHPVDDTGDFTFTTSPDVDIHNKETVHLSAPHDRAYNGSSLTFHSSLTIYDNQAQQMTGWQGGDVLLQKQSGKTWKTVAEKGSNVNGNTTFHYKGSGTGKFRVLGTLVRYLGPIKSNTVSWAQPHFTNCTAVHKKFSGGIAKTHTMKNTIRHRNDTATKRKLKGKVKHSTTWYNANKGLDRDHDGVACEKS